MIVKMKKVSLVIFDKYREESLKSLRKIGVVHLEQLQGRGEDYDRVYNINEKLKRALFLLPGDIDAEPAEYVSVERALELASEIAEKSEERKTVNDRMNALIKEIERIEPLGDFDPAIAAEISQREIGVSLYSINKLDEEVFIKSGAFQVGETKSKGYFAVIGEIPEELLKVDKFPMPVSSLGELNRQLDQAAEELAALDEQLAAMTAYRVPLQTALKYSGSDLEF
mgnify:CR=1 FL=1